MKRIEAIVHSEKINELNEDLNACEVEQKNDLMADSQCSEQME